jgi:hypothetical protein
MFIVIELQTNEQDQTANIVTSFSDKSLAESKYHQILAAAATSEVHTHSAVMLDERGNLEKSEYYLH